MKKILLILVGVLFLNSVEAQSWRRYPVSLYYANGTNHFMGDLGGGKKEAAHILGVRDLDYQVTRPTWQLGYRYRFHEYFTVRVNYTYALIAGKDANSGYFPRRARNLSFRSGIYELSTQIEYYFLKEKGSRKTSFSSLRAMAPLSAYTFIGVGVLYFNPKAKDPQTGKWIALQPLGTEGQYANPDGTPYTYTNYYTGEQLQTPKPYSRITGMVSVGLGVKYDLNKIWAVGLEFSYRYTFSDYIDDTHDRYFNYDDFGLTPPSPYTKVFSDRHLKVDYDKGVIYDEPGEPYHSGKIMRGDPNYNDAYILSMISVYYRLNRNARIRKPKYK